MADDAVSRLQSLLDAMPPVAALGVRVARCDAERVVLEAPLARNVNDKACAFGGSLASLLTLAGWGRWNPPCTPAASMRRCTSPTAR